MRSLLLGQTEGFKRAGVHGLPLLPFYRLTSAAGFVPFFSGPQSWPAVSWPAVSGYEVCVNRKHVRAAWRGVFDDAEGWLVDAGVQ